MYYYVWYDPDGKTGKVLCRFDSEEQVIDLLNLHAANAGFDFLVVKGHAISFEPAEVIKTYKRV